MRGMEKSKTKSDLTRAQIIQGALQALEKTGVIGTTTRRIAAEANVQLATLHYHFDSKSALLVAVLGALVDDIARRLREERLDPERDLDDRIEDLIRGTWRSVMRTKSRQIVQYELTLYALREGAQWLADQQYEAYLRLYRENLISARPDKQPLSSADYTSLARFILAGIDGLILQELAKPNRARSNQAVEALIYAAKQYSRDLLGEIGPPSSVRSNRSAAPSDQPANRAKATARDGRRTRLHQND
jgi:AcrR family transcriptional regulator